MHRTDHLIEESTEKPFAVRPRTKVCRLSLVVPCFNEEAVFPETRLQLTRLLERLALAGKIESRSQILFVDDGSRDATWSLIKSAHSEDPRIRGVKLSANRGHQVALLAGMFGAEGDAIVTIDADLQDDIDAIEAMVDAYLDGADIVYGVRSDRASDSRFKRSTAEAYYRLMGALGVKVVFNHADFRLMSRRALEALKGYSEVNLFLRGIVPMLGFSSRTVYYTRKARFAGETKYPLRKMIALAVDGVTSFTAYPLRLIALLGILVSMLSVAMVAWVLWIKLVANRAVPGWASSVIPVYFLGGIQLLSVGVLGEYVAKLYFEAKRRPRFFIEESL